MRNLIIPLLAAGALVLSTAPATADLGDQLFKLLPNDPGTEDEFGFSIAIDDGVVAVGVPLNNDNGSNSGSAYLFDASTGVQLFKLLPSDGAFSDEFGRSIAINNGVVAVGVRRDDDNGTDSGSVYLFDAATGAQLFKLLPDDGAELDWFGGSIAIDNGVVAVGAAGNDDNGGGSGSAYLFDASTGAQIFKLLPSDGNFGDAFGWSIAIDNGIAAIGARRDDVQMMNAGSAYLFDAGDTPGMCPWDLDNSGDVGVKDLLILLGVWGTCPAKGDCPADFDNSGDVGVKDLLFLLGAWGPCP